ncbi:MAG TPA: ArsA-related P-loop ATPase [Solirubrobacteraceae bacterium]|jgi:anion-transporting  ArsA/GET3 family ATPase
MTSVLNRELLVLSGKGGVGKTTLAAAIGLLAAQRGLRTIVVEVGDQLRLPRLFGLAGDESAAKVEPGREVELQERLWSVSIDPDRALLEWLQALGGRVSGRVLASSSTFQYFAAAAPGAKELVSMVKIWELTQSERWHRRSSGYDLVVLDAPATGHALGLLNSPRTFGAIARVGPIAGQAQRVRELLADPARSAYLAVARGSEMAVTETLELQEGLRRQLARALEAVLVNGILPRRFDRKELGLLSTLAESEHTSERVAMATSPRAPSATDDLLRSAAQAARAVHEGARFQRNQIARLRRHDLEVVQVPFVFCPHLDLAAVRKIVEHLDKRL